MALTATRTAVAFSGGATLAPSTYITSDVVDVGSLSPTGVALGLAVQIAATPNNVVATNTTDLVEILTSQDNSVWDIGTVAPTMVGVANPYANNTITFAASQATAVLEIITIPLAYPETIKYFKIRVSSGAGAGSSHGYAASVVKVA
jgi:hypothetical protein